MGPRAPVGYLRAALTEDWGQGRAVETAPVPSDAARAAAARGREARAEQEAEVDLRAQLRAARVARFAAVAELARKRNPTQRDADRRLFLSQIEDEFDRDDFRQNGWESALNARAIFAFWEEMQPGLFDGLPEMPETA